MLIAYATNKKPLIGTTLIIVKATPPGVLIIKPRAWK